MPVDTTHADYDRASNTWRECRDASAGQRAVHERGEVYLPKLSEQEKADYDAYKARALYYNATGRTVDGLSGLVFRKDIQHDIPNSLDFLADDVDTSGTPLRAFCEKTVDELLRVGRVGLLAEFPPVPPGMRKSQEEAMGIRPYAICYAAEDVINWRIGTVRNRRQLTLVVIQETDTAPEGDDTFKLKSTKQWRVLSLDAQGFYQQELYRKNEKGDAFVLVDGYPVSPTIRGGRKLDFIPFLFCGPEGVKVDVAKPPIEDLVKVNLSHYRSSADYENGAHYTGIPTPVITGHVFQKGEKFALGGSQAQAFPKADTQVSFLEFKGEGLSTLESLLERKEAMMVALGARMLAKEKKQVESAETSRIQRAGESSVLASLAIGASEAISKVLTWCAMFAGTGQEIRLDLNTDYIAAGLDAKEITALVDGWQRGAYSKKTLYDNLQRGEVAREGVTFDQEQADIEAEGPALGEVDTADDDPDPLDALIEKAVEAL